MAQVKYVGNRVGYLLCSSACFWQDPRQMEGKARAKTRAGREAMGKAKVVKRIARSPSELLRRMLGMRDYASPT